MNHEGFIVSGQSRSQYQPEVAHFSVGRPSGKEKQGNREVVNLADRLLCVKLHERSFYLGAVEVIFVYKF